MAVSQEKIRAKVLCVREAINENKFNNEQICLVLQYYDNDVTKTIAAFVEDGASEALQQWHTMGGGSKTTVAKKKKKKSKAKSKNSNENGVGASNLGPDDCSEAGSDTVTETINSNGSVNTQSLPPSYSGQESAETVSVDDSSSASLLGRDVVLSATTPSADTSKVKAAGKQTSSNIPVNRPSSLNSYQQQGKKGRDQVKSVQSNDRLPDFSADSSAATVSKKSQMSLDKSFKDLQRQTVSLERLKIVLNENVEKSFKRISEVFKELHKELSDREAQMVTELTQVKLQAHNVLAEQESHAKVLRQKTERSSAMNDNDLLQLRADIKHFVGDRKLYEDMCSAPMFACSINQILDEMRSFGQVNPVTIRAPLADVHVLSTPILSTEATSHSHQIHSASTSVKPALSAKEQQSQVKTPPSAASLHVLTQSDSLTRYEESERKIRLANSHSSDQSVRQTSPPVERSGVGRGHKSPIRGGGAGRGRNNRQNGGSGNQSEGTGRGSRTFYNSHTVSNSASQSNSRARGAVDHATDHPAARSLAQSGSVKNSVTETADSSIASKVDASAGNGTAVFNGDVAHNTVDQKIVDKHPKSSVGSKTNQNGSLSTSSGNDQLPANGHGHKSEDYVDDAAAAEVGMVKGNGAKSKGTLPSTVSATEALNAENNRDILPQHPNRRTSEKRHNSSTPSIPVDNGFLALVPGESQGALPYSS